MSAARPRLLRIGPRPQGDVTAARRRPRRIAHGPPTTTSRSTSRNTIDVRITREHTGQRISQPVAQMVRRLILRDRPDRQSQTAAAHRRDQCRFGAHRTFGALYLAIRDGLAIMRQAEVCVRATPSTRHERAAGPCMSMIIAVVETGPRTSAPHVLRARRRRARRSLESCRPWGYAVGVLTWASASGLGLPGSAVRSVCQSLER
jgi:hypothetical protein